MCIHTSVYVLTCPLAYVCITEIEWQCLSGVETPFALLNLYLPSRAASVAQLTEHLHVPTCRYSTQYIAGPSPPWHSSTFSCAHTALSYSILAVPAVFLARLAGGRPGGDNNYNRLLLQPTVSLLDRSLPPLDDKPNMVSLLTALFAKYHRPRIETLATSGNKHQRIRPYPSHRYLKPLLSSSRLEISNTCL